MTSGAIGGVYDWSYAAEPVVQVEVFICEVFTIVPEFRITSIIYIMSVIIKESGHYSANFTIKCPPIFRIEDPVFLGYTLISSQLEN